MLDRSSIRRAEPAMAAYLLAPLDFERALSLLERLVYESGADRTAQISLIICEHPPTITVGRHGSRADIRLDDRELARRRLTPRWVNRGGGTIAHAPGQLAVYPVVPLEARGWTIGEYLGRLQTGLEQALAECGHVPLVGPGRYGIWGRTGQLATVGVAAKRGTTYFGAYVNVTVSPRDVGFVAASRADVRPMSSLAAERRSPPKITTVRQALVRHLAAAFDCERYNIFSRHHLLTPPAVKTNAAVARAG
jgi:lipoate-protein ligase B